jgi:spore coat protein CotF
MYQMNDQYLMENYLLILKSNMEVYTHGTLESFNHDIRSTLYNSLQDTLSSQENTFNIMMEYGYYNVSNISNKDIKKSIKKLRNN